MGAAWRRALVVMVGVAMLAGTILAGCGGDEEGEGTASWLTKQQFIQRANAACRRISAGVEQELAEFLRQRKEAGTPRSELYGDVAQFVIAPRAETQMEAIRALEASPREEKRIADIVYSEQLAVDRLATTDEPIPSLGAIRREYAESARRMRAYGLTACANSPKL